MTMTQHRCDEDRIAQSIVDVANKEINKGSDAVVVFTGVLLALYSMLHGMRVEESFPFLMLKEATSMCLEDLLHEDIQQRKNDTR